MFCADYESWFKWAIVERLWFFPAFWVKGLKWGREGGSATVQFFGLRKEERKRERERRQKTEHGHRIQLDACNSLTVSCPRELFFAFSLVSHFSDWDKSPNASLFLSLYFLSLSLSNIFHFGSQKHVTPVTLVSHTVSHTGQSFESGWKDKSESFERTENLNLVADSLDTLITNESIFLSHTRQQRTSCSLSIPLLYSFLSFFFLPLSESLSPLLSLFLQLLLSPTVNQQHPLFITIDSISVLDLNY